MSPTPLEEKHTDVFVEVASTDEEPLAAQGTPERTLAERKLVRKLDYRILPTIILIYIMNYIDVGPPPSVR